MKRTVLGLTCAIITLVASNASYCDPLPTGAAVPGGVAVVTLPPSWGDRPVFFEEHRVLVRQTETGPVAVVGIPLSAQPGSHVLRSGVPPGGGTVSFDVTPRTYPEQRITLTNPKMVNPDEEQLKRIGDEQRQMTAAFTTYSDDLTATLALQKPVDGPISSVFGLRRFFNDQPRRPHSGIDYAAPRGTVVVAPAPGRVSRVDNYYFNGNTVLIDHGEGLVTMYCHLDSTAVEVGQNLAGGEPIGRVGASGRATGPHLHWSVSLNGVRVDPQLLLANDG